MVILSFNRSHQVLLARVSGVFASSDMADLDNAVIRFLAHRQEDAELRALYDFSNVEAIAVPASKFAERGRQPPIVRGLRVLVAPAGAGENFGTSFRNQQRIAGNTEPLVVASLSDAYTLLGLHDPVFEPVEQS
jgi:hypothetical protein